MTPQEERGEKKRREDRIGGEEESRRGGGEEERSKGGEEERKGAEDKRRFVGALCSPKCPRGMVSIFVLQEKLF